MRFHRFLKSATVALIAAAVGFNGLGAQTATNATTNTNAPASPPRRPVTSPAVGDAKIIGSTISPAAMPQHQESLGDAARRLRKKKKKKSRKAQQRRPTARPRPQL